MEDQQLQPCVGAAFHPVHCVSSRGDPVHPEGHMCLPPPSCPEHLRTVSLGTFLLRIRLILGRAVAKET